MQANQRKNAEDTLAAMSIENDESDWVSDVESQMRAIEAAVRSELDEAAVAMHAAEPVGDATVRHRRQIGNTNCGSSSSVEAKEMILSATRGSRNHRQVAERLHLYAEEVEAQLQLGK